MCWLIPLNMSAIGCLRYTIISRFFESDFKYWSNFLRCRKFRSNKISDDRITVWQDVSAISCSNFLCEFMCVLSFQPYNLSKNLRSKSAINARKTCCFSKQLSGYKTPWFARVFLFAYKDCCNTVVPVFGVPIWRTILNLSKTHSPVLW